MHIISLFSPKKFEISFQVLIHTPFIAVGYHLKFFHALWQFLLRFGDKQTQNVYLTLLAEAVENISVPCKVRKTSIYGLLPTTKFEAGRGQPTSIYRCVVYNHHHETKTIVEPNSDNFSHDFHDYIRPNRTLIVVHFAASKRSRRSLHDRSFRWTRLP